MELEIVEPQSNDNMHAFCLFTSVMQRDNVLEIMFNIPGQDPRFLERVGISKWIHCNNFAP
jgi:hypothetical protein